MAAKTQQKRKTSKSKKEIRFPLEKENIMIIGAGIAMLIVGYLLMNQNSVDGFVPTIISPIILVVAYLIVIPYGILKKPKSVVTSAETVVTESAERPVGNVKTS